MTETLLWDLAETARQLGGVSERTVRRLIDAGAIARVRIGRRVLVLADSVKAHLDRAAADSDNHHRAGPDVREKSTCRIDARKVRFGGSVTPIRAASELDDLLARPTGGRRPLSKPSGSLSPTGRVNGRSSPKRGLKR